MNKQLTIVLTGGGTGGHIVPILAVASELKKVRPDIRLVYVAQSGGVLSDLPAQHPAIDAVYSVRAGKFRRYLGSRWQQLIDVRMQAKNLADIFWVVVGIWQSYWLMRKLNPAIIFTRGGYVSVPVALGGLLRGVPFITHDSDSTPSLANRILARWAAVHAVALPKELYPYDPEHTVEVGVPVSGEYVPVTSKLQQEYRQQIGLAAFDQILFVTGGGNGAADLNNLVASEMPYLLEKYPNLVLVHVAGRALADGLQQHYDQLLGGESATHVQVKSFLTNMQRYSGAADVVIGRGGASSLAEFAVQGKACIVIPAPHLSWQIHHAQTLADQQAIVAVAQQEAGTNHRLAREVSALLDDAAKRAALAKHLSAFAKDDAAARLAALLLEHMRGAGAPTHYIKSE